MAVKTARFIRDAIRNGTMSATEAVEDCLARIASRGATVHAWSHLDPDQARAEARRLDAVPQAARGPLHGVPIGIKDVLLTRDMPTQYGSALTAGFAPVIDAAAVTVLRAAGALILGKTHTVEFAAIGAKPPTRNPANPDHTPGGSSSGSAAAVADGQVPLAIGTQTGGSIIRPASFCGAWALKPTWGLVDRDGAKMFAASLDTIGWFGQSADDLSLLLDVFALNAAPQPDIARAVLRIAMCRTPMWEAAEATTRAAFDQAEAALRTAGVQVDWLELPPMFDPLADDHATIMFGEGRSAFLAAWREHGDALDPVFRDMVANGPRHPELLAALDRAAAARPVFDAIAAPYDAVIVPSTPGTAPEGLANGGSYRFNGLWTMLHTPCVNIPMPQAADGLPIGLTATGPRFSDARVVAAAASIGAAITRP